MNLVIDQGNTGLKYGIFQEGKLLKSGKGPEIPSENYDAMIISGVAPIPEPVHLLSESISKIIRFDHSTPLPFHNAYATPETLGSDRLANAAGAFLLYPHKNCLVIDAGTCLKFDFIDDQDNYRGGGISPGLTMRFRALHEFTSALPLLNPSEAAIPLIGNSTYNSIQSGVVNGMLAEISEIISRYEEKYPEVQLILTGGDLRYFRDKLKSRIFAAPSLTLQGLDFILRYNQ